MSDTTLDVTSPFDGSLLKTIKKNSAAEALKMLATARQLYQDRDQWLEPHERIEILNNLAKLVNAEAESFATLIAQEGGKPLVDAKIEVARAVDGILLAAKEISHVCKGEEIPMGLTAPTQGRMAFTFYEPIGVVLAISAFNHPLNLIVHQVVPAIAVGCPVIVKPAGTTPLNCLRLCALINKAGLPEGWCQALVCDVPVISQLAQSKDINFLTFIGSGAVGWKLRSELAPGVRCALEHGGVAPVIIDESADLEAAIPSLLKGGFYHAGQVCVSVQRIFTPTKIAEQLAQSLADGAKQLKVGAATKADTEVGPLISSKEVDRVDDWVQEAVIGGAKLMCGGKKLSATTYAPTVLLDPPVDCKLSTQEIFGPVMCVYSYADRLQAIAHANSLDAAFQAAVFSNDLSVTLDTVKRLDASAVMVNDHTAFRADWMPFAGRRASGYGTGGIGYTMHDMVQAKMMVLRS